MQQCLCRCVSTFCAMSWLSWLSCLGCLYCHDCLGCLVLVVMSWLSYLPWLSWLSCLGCLDCLGCHVLVVLFALTVLVVMSWLSYLPWLSWLSCLDCLGCLGCRAVSECGRCWRSVTLTKTSRASFRWRLRAHRDQVLSLWCFCCCWKRHRTCSLRAPQRRKALWWQSALWGGHALSLTPPLS